MDFVFGALYIDVLHKVRLHRVAFKTNSIIDVFYRVRLHKVSFKMNLITLKFVINWKGVYKLLLYRWALCEWLGFDNQNWGLVVYYY